MTEPELASKSRPKNGKRVTKRSVMVDLLRRQSGATVEEICEACNWKTPAVIGYLQFIRWTTENGITQLLKRTRKDGTNVYRVA